MTMPAAAPSLRFGRFELQAHERRLLVDGEPAPLGGRAFDLLLALVERAGSLVTKRALMDLVWPDVVVQENNLAAQVSALRKVVGEGVIATIPGRGYRFVARIVPAGEGEFDGDAGATGGQPPAAPVSGRGNHGGALPFMQGDHGAVQPFMQGEQGAAPPFMQGDHPAAPRFMHGDHAAAPASMGGDIGAASSARGAGAAGGAPARPGDSGLRVPEPAASDLQAASAASDFEAASAAQRQAVPALRTNLPGALVPLLGRADDLAALGALVAAHRLVTVVGPGGIGKSLLTQHLLHGQRDAYPQGVCWVELAPVTEPPAVPGAVAAALGVHLGPGEPLAALVAAVAPLRMLLALDNAEHGLAEVARLCQALHDGAPDLRMVVTSQAPLRLAAERVFRIGPLAVPAGALPAAQAQAFGAVALFAERAQAVGQAFALTDANAALVIELCRALDGLPLAIELAAARAPMLGMHRLLASMQDRLKLLTASRNRAAPTRQRTLRAALEWSHGFLQPQERRVFRRLGVMAGSASLEFVQQVVADGNEGGELDEWAVLDALDGLVDRSLVAVLATPGEGAPRYRLLETPRAYALERLDEAGERDALRRRHALALAVMFDSAYDEYFSGCIGTDDWQDGLGPDLDNARDALAWAREAGDTGVGLTIGATLLRALPPSLHAERMALADACEAALAAPVPDPLRLRTWIELSCAWADTQKLRTRDAAEHALELARRLDRPQDDRFPLYHALCRAASARAQAGDLQAARAPLAELQGLEDRGWPAQRLIWGAEAAQVVARLCGDAAQALALGRRLVALDRARGSDATIALGNLIDAELAAGDAEGAARSGSALVQAWQGTRHEYSLAFARLNLCAACLALDDCARARPVAQAAWPQALVFDLRQYAAGYIALLAALEGRPRAAARLLGYAGAIYAAREEAREANEAAAMARAADIARKALGDAGFECWHAEGATLRDSEVGALAFASQDV